MRTPRSGWRETDQAFLFDPALGEPSHACVPEIPLSTVFGQGQRMKSSSQKSEHVVVIPAACFVGEMWLNE